MRIPGTTFSDNPSYPIEMQTSGRSIMQIKVKKLNPRATLPRRGSDGAVGYDLFPISEGDIHMPSESRMNFPLGIAIEFPKGYAALILDKSGMGNKGLTKLAGVIDPDYRGEWIVIMHNTNPYPVVIPQGKSIAQVLFVPIALPDVVEVTELSHTVRGDGKFGSTGN